jgi:hypothetical protein
MSKNCCSQSQLVFDPTEIRMNTLFEIYCKFITNNIKKTKQQELVNLSAATNANFTIFKLKGSDYVRIKTSVQEENGKYAINTKLEINSPEYAALKAGKSYQGTVVLYGKSYYAWYWIINDKYAGYFGIAN